VCSAIIMVDDINGLFQSIPFYVLTMVVSLIIQGLICTIAYLVITRKNVFRFIKNITEALVFAVATSSRYLGIFFYFSQNKSLHFIFFYLIIALPHYH